MLHFDENGVPTIRRSLPMALFGLGLVLSLLLTPVGLTRYTLCAIRGVDETGQMLPPDWRLMFGVLSGLYLVLFLLVAVTADAYFNRRRVARWLIVVAIVSALAIGIVDAAWSISLADGDDQYIAETISFAIRSSLIPMGWLIYFLVSKRVRETLVYPLSA